MRKCIKILLSISSSATYKQFINIDGDTVYSYIRYIIFVIQFILLYHTHVSELTLLNCDRICNTYILNIYIYIYIIVIYNIYYVLYAVTLKI